MINSFYGFDFFFLDSFFFSARRTGDENGRRRVGVCGGMP